jgi:hypothetical protein
MWRKNWRRRWLELDWWEVIGWEDGSVQDMRKRGVVGEDCVHLTDMVNGTAAVNLCHRLAKMQLLERSGGDV